MAKVKFSAYLVDDSDDDRLFLRKALERSGKIEVVGEAYDGEEAIQHFQHGNPHPDIMLLDIKMPRKNGFDVLEWLRSQAFGDMKVVVVSGSWLAEDVARSLSLGACAHFKKSALRAEQDEMVRSIEKILESDPPPEN